LKSTVLVIGRSGQVARALARCSSQHGLSYGCLGRPEIDLAHPRSLKAALDRRRPQLIVNAAAWTEVDRAETEPAAAFRVNAEGPQWLARWCRSSGVPLIQLSTDYVFNGEGHRPYRSEDPISPLNIYGRSKAAGEAAVRTELNEHVIVRLAWLYDAAGRNFLNAILRLAEQRPSIDVVDDQKGSPTFACDAATGIDVIAGRILNPSGSPLWGICHLANAGETTWRGFAEQLLDDASRFGHPRPAVRPIPSSEYATAARRPRYSVLDTSLARERYGVRLPEWRDAVSRCIAEKFTGREEARRASRL
jgi:dTDP-4-dehydrorhamnose reductase